MAVRSYGMVGLALMLWMSSLVAGQEASPSVTGSVPRLVAFNGYIHDRNGQPHGGVTTLRFGLYKESEGGTPLWTEVQNVNLNEQGAYSVYLGATEGALPSSLFTSGEPRWLGVQTETGEEQPRVFLLSVPYALKAGDADTIGGKPASAFVLVPPSKTNIADDGKTSTASAIGGNTTTFAATGTGSANTVAKWIDGAGTLGNSILTDNGTQVGISNNSPSVTLDVSGPIRSVFGPNAPYGAYLVPTAGAPNGFRFGLGNNLYFDGTNWRTKGDGANNAGSAFLTDIGVGALAVYAVSSTGGSDQVIPNANLNGFEKMRIQGDGRVGIGTSTPATALDVSGVVRAVTGAGAPFGTYLMPNGGAANSFRLGYGNNLYFDGANWRTKGDGSNNAGSAIVSDIGGGNLSIYTLPSTGGADQVVPNATFNSFEKIRITGAGDMGIGTAPTAKLDVAGNIKGSGTITGSQLVSSVATGTQPLAVNSTTQVANLNASLLGGQPASSFLPTSSPALARVITYLGGCDTCSVLLDTDSQKMIYVNVLNTSLTLLSVTCFSDAGTPSINLHRASSGSNVLSSNISCSTAGVSNSSFNSGEATLNPNENLDFVMASAGGVAKRVTVIVKATY
jgi:hypothetical protein